MRILWGVFALALVSACGNGGAPSCKDAVEKAVKSGAKASESQQQVIIDACENKKWSAEIRSCLAKATSKGDARECLKPVMADLDAFKDRLRDKLDEAKGDLDALSGRAREAADQARAAADQARTAAGHALEQAQQAIAQVDDLQKQLAAQKTEIEARIKAVVDATSDDARAKAKAALAELQAKQTELELKLKLAVAAAEVAAKAHGAASSGSGSGE